MRGISSPGSSFRSSVGRGLAPAVPEGFVLSCRARPPGRAVSVVFRRGFRRLRAASFFPSDGKETNGPGHLLLALGLRKIRANAAPFPRLSLPNQRYRFRETGYLIRPLRGHLPLKGKAGAISKPSPLGEGAERSEADEGDFLKFAAASGSPKGLPCQVRESSLRTAGEGRTPEKTPSAEDQFPPRRGFQRIKIIRTAVKSHTRRSCCS